MAENDTLKNKLRKATLTFLRMADDMEVVNEDFEGCVVAKDWDTDQMVFVLMTASIATDEFRDEDAPERVDFERAVARWFKNSDNDVNIGIRGDIAHFLVIGDDRAIIRYKRNAYV